MAESLVTRYLERVGLEGSELSVEALQRAHVTSIPFENVDVLLGRGVDLDMSAVVAKLVDRRRGGYCFEQNSLFAAVLEEVGYRVTRCLGRVRLGAGDGPRPATHMCLIVDDQLVDVGFGAPTPLGPVPLGGQASYDGPTWKTQRVVSPEGEDAWLLSMGDMPLYTFTDVDHHPVDFVAPNHLTSTHPTSHFTTTLIVQRWRDDAIQVGLVGLDLLVRDPYTQVRLNANDLERTLREVFDLAVTDEDVLLLQDRLRSLEL